MDFIEEVIESMNRRELYLFETMLLPKIIAKRKRVLENEDIALFRKQYTIVYKVTVLADRRFGTVEYDNYFPTKEKMEHYLVFVNEITKVETIVSKVNVSDLDDETIASHCSHHVRSY